MTDDQHMKKDAGKMDMTFTPPEIRMLVNDPFVPGAAKYGRDLWRNGMDERRLHAAALRHLAKFEMGERYDQEIGSHHLACAAWNLLTWAMQDLYHLNGYEGMLDQMSYEEFEMVLYDAQIREQFLSDQAAKKDDDT